MYRDFIVKQTSDFDSQFKARTLVGNWYEERCNPSRPDNFHFYKERKTNDDNKNPTLHEVNHKYKLRIISKFPPLIGLTSKMYLHNKPSKPNTSNNFNYSAETIIWNLKINKDYQF